MHCDLCDKQSTQLTSARATDYQWLCNDCCKELNVRVPAIRIFDGDGIRERWMAAQKQRKRERLNAFLESRRAS